MTQNILQIKGSDASMTVYTYILMFPTLVFFFLIECVFSLKVKLQDEAIVIIRGKMVGEEKKGGGG